MLLIGITGAKGTGKDSVFSAAEEWAAGNGLHFVRRAFADKLKLSACRLFYPEATMEEALRWADQIKIESAARVWMFKETLVEVESHNSVSEFDSKETTGRQLLQRYGTEAHRDVFGPNFWVDQLLPVDNWEETALSGFWIEKTFPQAMFVTDVRFDNEAARIAKLGGDVWHIERPGYGTGDSHASEQKISSGLTDRTILNDGTLEELNEAVARLLRSHYSYRLRGVIRER